MEIKKIVMSLFILILFQANSSLATNCTDAVLGITHPEGNVATQIGVLLFSTTSAPILSLTCVVATAEVNEAMLKREATLLQEEGKIFQPSFLGRYADQNGLTIPEAANHILTNGIQ